MVDQGPKGFCVPATWERLLRYMGIPADMYVLAMAANTGQGGGTSVAQMTVAAQPLLARQGRRLEAAGSRPELRSLAECLDKGKPVMWCLAVSPELEKEMLARTAERKAMTDPAAWKKQLAAAAKGRPPLRRDPENAHMRLIIGYNPVSGEVAVSDSWGPAFAERWMTLEEAQALTLGPLQAVSW
jgi:hypothetical protein